MRKRMACSSLCRISSLIVFSKALDAGVLRSKSIEVSYFSLPHSSCDASADVISATISSRITWTVSGRSCRIFRFFCNFMSPLLIGESHIFLRYADFDLICYSISRVN